MKRVAGFDGVTMSVVAFQEGDLWVAQGVNYAIAAHAADLPGLLSAFERAVLRNLAINVELGRQGLDGIPPAAARFAEMFESPDALDLSRATARLESPQSPPPVRIDSLRVVEARAA